ANRSTVRASFAGRPRTRSTTRRAFDAEVRTYRATARAPGAAGASVLAGIPVTSVFSYPVPASPASNGANPGRSAPAGLAVFLLVSLERAGQGELAELVPDHRLGDVHRHVLAAVVHRDRVAQHLRDDGRTPRPGLDDLLGVPLVQRHHLLHQVVVDERTLLQTAWHVVNSLSLSPGLAPGPTALAGGTAAHDHLVVGLALTPGTTLGLTRRVHRVTAPGGLPFTTTVRVVDRVHGHTPNARALALPAHPA